MRRKSAADAADVAAAEAAAAARHESWPLRFSRAPSPPARSPAEEQAAVTEAADALLRSRFQAVIAAQIALSCLVRAPRAARLCGAARAPPTQKRGVPSARAPAQPCARRARTRARCACGAARRPRRRARARRRAQRLRVARRFVVLPYLAR
jgi:hypothetical protein